MNKKNAVNGIMILVSLLMVGGMALTFLPKAGESESGPNLVDVVRGEQGKAAIRVNGKPITAERLQSVESSNPSPFSAQGGVLQDDYRTYLVSQIIRQEVMTQAASDINVTRDEVAAEVTKVREQNKLTDDAAWTDALQRVGLSDSEYRTQVHDGLAIQRKTEEIQAAVPAVTEEEMKLYYDLNPTLFQTQARLRGRQIAVDNEAKAKELLAQARSGADFAKLARENSLENAENGGALGAVGKDGKLPAVEPVVLPTEVAQAVAALPAAGLTEVVASGGRFYIVQVEEQLPPQTKPYKEVEGEVRTALETSKKAAAVENFLDEQLAAAKIEIVDPAWKYENPTVAEVAGKAIPYSEVVGRVLQNQQLMMMMQSMDSAQLGEMVNGMLKPSVVDSLIREYAAPTIVQQEKIPLVGTRADLASGLVAYGGRDVKVTEADIEAAYEEQKPQFQTPASATLSEATFASKEAAQAFRQSWQGGDFTADATKAGSTVSERGKVDSASQAVAPEVLKAAFTGELRAVSGGISLSAPMQAPDGWKVLAVTDLQPARTLPLEEVRTTLQTNLFNQKQAEAGEAYLSGKVEALKPVNKLEEVLAAQAARVAAATPAASGAAASGAAVSGTAASDAAASGAATSAAAASDAATTVSGMATSEAATEASDAAASAAAAQ